MALGQFQRQVVAGNQLATQNQYSEDNYKFILNGSNIYGEQIHIPVGERMLSRHMLFLGGIGTGKTNGINFMIKNVLNNLYSDDVVIIFDTKGDFYKEFYTPGDIVISNDERACGPNGEDYWNIFNEVTVDDRLEENIIEIANALFADKIAHSTQPFFPNAAKDLFFATMLYIIRSGKDSFRSNNGLRKAFNKTSAEEDVTILNKYPDTKAMKSYISDPKSGQTLGVLSELQQAVREVFVGNFAKKGTMSIRDIIRKKGGQVVFVEYDLGIGSMLTPIYRILIDSAIKEALSRKVNDGNVYFFIDEFKLLPNLQHIDDGVNFGRSLGAKFIIGIQNVSQLYESYGEYLTKSILSGFGTTLSFRVSDYESREFIKSLYGQNIKQQSLLSTINARGLQEVVQEGNVIEDEDIFNLKLGQCIFGAPECEPFIFRFPKYVERAK